MGLCLLQSCASKRGVVSHAEPDVQISASDTGADRPVVSLLDKAGRKVAQIQNEFAFRLLRETAGKDNGNLCLQTFGLFELAAQQAMLSSKEDERRWLHEIGADTLGITMDDIVRYCRLVATPRPDDRRTRCRFSNSLWLGKALVDSQEGRIESSTLDRLRESFGTGIFEQDPATCQGLVDIDTWIDSVSSNRIPLGLKSGETSRRMLVNVTDFQGELKYPFSKELEFLPRWNTFEHLNGGISETFKMRLKSPVWISRHDDYFQLGFPYLNERYVMVAVLPRVNKYGQVISRIDITSVAELFSLGNEESLDIMMVPFASKSICRWNSLYVVDGLNGYLSNIKARNQIACSEGNQLDEDCVSMGYFAFGWKGTSGRSEYRGELSGNWNGISRVGKQPIKLPGIDFGRPFLYFVIDQLTHGIILQGQITTLENHFDKFIFYVNKVIDNEFSNNFEINN